MLEDLNNFLDSKELQTNIGGNTKEDTTNLSPRDIKVNDFYTRCEKNGINLNDLREILNYQGTMQINSGAGSGKTTALVLKIIFDVVTGDCTKTVVIPSVNGGNTVEITPNILVTTFLKSGAEELKRSFEAWLMKLGYSGVDTSKIVFKTLHAEVYSVLNGLGIDMNIVTDNTATYRSVMKNLRIRNTRSLSKTITIDEVRDIECITSYVRNRLDDKKFVHPLMDEYGLTKELMELFLKQTKVLRRSSGSLDYEDMQELLLDGLKTNKSIANYVQSRYDYIYCDEFQDTSQLQYAILQYYFSSAKKVVVIGDDDQCIYSWRGSDINIITSYFEEDYTPKIFTLAINYRCKKNILNAVVPSIVKNKQRVEKELYAHNDGGSVLIKKNYSVLDLIEEVKKSASDGKTVGILSRTNNDLLIPALVLELDGTVPFSISKSVGVHNKLPRTIFGIIKLLTSNYDERFEEYFSMFLSYYNRGEAEVLCDILSMNKDKSIFTLSAEDLEYSVPDLWNNFLCPVRNLVKGGMTIKAYTDLLLMFKLAYDNDSTYCRRARDLIQFLIDFCDEYPPNFDDLDKIDVIINKTLPERLSNRIARGKSDVPVKLSTVHEAKGKEWDNVFIWNDTDGVFPVKVNNRSITTEEMEEERRVHYIAWTRAKNRLVVYTFRGMFSPFLKECDVENVMDNTGVHKRKLSESSEESITEPEYVVQLCLEKRGNELGISEDTQSTIIEMVNTLGLDRAIEHFKEITGANK